MAYTLRGTYFENCNCDVVCPCGASNMFLSATYDRCRVLLAFHIDEGEIDGTDVSGKCVALFADTPAQMTEGGWRVGAFLDASASEEQRDKLMAVFSGQQGGAPALFAPLMGEMLGVEVAPIVFADNGRKHSVRIGDDVDLEVEDFAGAEEGSVMTLSGIGHPANSTLTIGHAVRSKIQAFGFDLDLTGKNAHAAPFAWQN
jgi:hypothetical protein